MIRTLLINFFEIYFYKTIYFTLALAFVTAFVIYILFVFRKKREKILEELINLKTESIQEEKRKTEEALQKAQVATKKERKQVELSEKLNQEKTEIMRIVTHNLKNPISAIKGSIELVLANLDDKDTIQELMYIINDASDEMLSTITQFLDHSEIENIRFKLSITDFNLVNIIQNIIKENNLLAANKNLSIQFENNIKTQSNLRADKRKISSVLDNLLSNAIKYSKKGKTILIRVSESENSYHLSVIDEGPGLTENDLKRVFGKFERLSARPTGDETSSGLGLAIVKRIIELHNGEVGVHSKAGQGSEFYFILPKNCSSQSSLGS